jgi:hypothetical protein
MNNIYKGGHDREDLPHYHNMVKLPNGKVINLSSAEHCVSAPATESCSAIKSWTVEDLIDAIKYHLEGNRFNPDKPFTTFIGIYEDNYNQTGPITYYKIMSSDGSQGVPTTTKLRNIRFGTQELKRETSIKPFIVVYDDDNNNEKYNYLHCSLEANSNFY